MKMRPRSNKTTVQPLIDRQKERENNVEMHRKYVLLYEAGDRTVKNFQSDFQDKPGCNKGEWTMEIEI
jgi:hypothetical protein